MMSSGIDRWLLIGIHIFFYKRCDVVFKCAFLLSGKWLIAKRTEKSVIDPLKIIMATSCTGIILLVAMTFLLFR